ncbi:MAG: hypothetical protein J6T40_01605 [Clostridiales bacterium]|nr:hypothetical protein [Clostridiales bacterium]
MSCFWKNNAKRITAGILGFLVLLILIFSSFYIAVESDHVCCGEHCPVCITLHQCESILKIFHTATEKVDSDVVPLLLLSMVITFVSHFSFSETPVSQKVRMNN